ncbi:hypothetical protein Hanom_Chr03g00187441 [Helianthus anomalus]
MWCLFFKKFYAASPVCAAQTTRRHCHLQTICFSEDVSLKNVCASSSWCRLDPTISKIFRGLHRVKHHHHHYRPPPTTIVYHNHRPPPTTVHHPPPPSTTTTVHHHHPPLPSILHSQFILEVYIR